MFRARRISKTIILNLKPTGGQTVAEQQVGDTRMLVHTAWFVLYCILYILVRTVWSKRRYGIRTVRIIQYFVLTSWYSE